MRGISNLCDYFIICSGDTAKQVQAIYEEVIKFSHKNNFNIYHTEKDPSFNWLIVDYFDIILHIFSEEARKFYDLEHLWNEAKRIVLEKSVRT